MIACSATAPVRSSRFRPSWSRAPRRASFACLAPSHRGCGRLLRSGGAELPLLFPFCQYWWLYAALIGVVLALLALDLGVFHRTPHRVSFREAAAWCAVWVAIAVLFNIALYAYGLWRFPLDP